MSTNSTPSAVSTLPAHSAPEQNRLTLPVVLAVIAFPVLGTALAITGMPTEEIVPLLSFCAGIGVISVLMVSGGRRLITALAVLSRAAQQ